MNRQWEKIVRITQRVDDLAQTGKGILDGMEWTVRTDSKEVLEKDTLARVIRISGVKLIVERIRRTRGWD